MLLTRLALVISLLVSTNAWGTTPIRAQTLCAAYKRSEPNAERKYGNKDVLVVGVVKDTNLTTTSSLIRLECTGFFTDVYVYVYLPPEDKQANTIKRGDKILVKGVCRGLSLGSVVINEAEIVKQ
jgi:hypothetical protein